MHRSGTSLTTSWLEVCGLRIHDGAFYGPETGNPKGHFEDKDFVDLHSSAIELEKPKSNGWKLFADKFFAFEAGHLSNARKLVDQRNAKYNLWGWKDPRSVIYLTQWKEIIPSLKVLLLWRPCSEVASSLIRRSRKARAPVFKINILDSVKLWMAYNERVCEYKQQNPDDAVLFPLEHVIEHDQDVLKFLNKKFRINLEYRRIGDLYDQKLLTRGPTPLLLTRLASLYYRTDRLETRLQQLSDI